MLTNNKIGIIAPEGHAILSNVPTAGYSHIKNINSFSSNENDSSKLEILIVDHSSWGKKLETYLKRNKLFPSILLLASEEEFRNNEPNYSDDFWIYVQKNPFHGEEEFNQVVQLAHQSYKKRMRLLALKEHHNQWNSREYNPIMQLITDLTKSCTSAEDYNDLIKPLRHLQSSCEFQDAAVIFYDSKHNSVFGFSSEDIGKTNGIHVITKPQCISLDFSSLNAKSIIINNDGTEAHNINYLTKNPWSSCMVMEIQSALSQRRKNGVKYAQCFLFRRKLISFTERDLWLFELAQGPLSLGLEKIIMLKTINRASKEWRSTFDAISEPITVVDSSFQIIKANKAFANLIHQDIKKIKNKKCYSLLASRKTPCNNCPAQNKNGELKTAKIRDKSKNDLLAWSYSIDLNNENFHFQFYRNMAKENALMSALVQSEKLAALGKLVGAIAHEINNPLAGILATSQLLLADEKELIALNITEEMGEIKSAAWRSKKIIDDLLGFTEGYIKSSELVDINECIHTALVFSKSALKNIRLKFELPDNIPKIHSSSSSIQQVIFNLITNAAHAMKDEGDLIIKSKFNNENKEIQIEVTDSGPGIPAEKLKNIFDPFYTSKEEGQGTGLGLSIVKNLLNKIGAKITVNSNAGIGTSFYITIPQGNGDG